jgi:hypothetical protein
MVVVKKAWNEMNMMERRIGNFERFRVGGRMEEFDILQCQTIDFTHQTFRACIVVNPFP